MTEQRKPILSLELTGDDFKNLESVIYVAAADGKKVKPGMDVQVSPTTVRAEEAYKIKDRKICEQVHDVVLTGNVFEALMNIDAIGNDRALFGGLGGCGKGGQSPLLVSDGGPHIRIKDVTIGGR
jgi:predicted Zn-dependent protease